MTSQCLGIGLALGMAMQGKENQENPRQDKARDGRLSKARHGEVRKGLGLGLGLHAICCYKIYLVERLVFISFILNKALSLCCFPC
jgi:hypothetical protein